ncbi:MAG TPA: hypothetical protein VGK74_17120 [Symbiobacteriaceae bacterium]|jgi:hypothetical protein
MVQAKGRIRFVLLATGLFTLIMAMWAGLVRMGWVLPGLTPSAVGGHGPLMVSGFLGTVIGLERAVGVGKPWMLLAPLLTGLGALGLIIGLPTMIGAVFITLGSLCLAAIFGYIVRHEPALHTLVMSAGALFWVGGNLLWVGGYGIPQVVPWWAAYLVLTIAGERLELSRLVQIPRSARTVFMAFIALLAIGLGVHAFLNPALGWRIFGASAVLLAGWLLTYDVARRTVQIPGLTRFIASCMLSGYVWLGIAGLIALFKGFLYGGYYDAALHGIFLGFVVVMIFGHAPVIFPAVLGMGMKFRPAFYLHLVLLHLSLLLRVGADLVDWVPGRLWGGMLNAVALTVFLVSTVLAIRAARQTPAPRVRK